MLPPKVYPPNTCCNTQSRVKFDKTSINSNLPSQPSTFTLFPVFLIHWYIQKSKDATFESTSWVGFATLLSSERNFSITPCYHLGSSEAQAAGPASSMPPSDVLALGDAQPTALSCRSLSSELCSQLRAGPREVPTAHTALQTGIRYLLWKLLWKSLFFSSYFQNIPK